MKYTLDFCNKKTKQWETLFSSESRNNIEELLKNRCHILCGAQGNKANYRITAKMDKEDSQNV